MPAGTSFIPRLVYGTGPTTVDFVYPPEKDSDEQHEGDKNESIALSGLRQVSINHIEVTRQVDFTFLTLAQLNDLKTFFYNWGVFAKSFTWYVHKEDNTSGITYELKDLKVPQVRKIPKGTFFLYGLTLTFRRYV